MDDTLDQASKDAVTALAMALQDGIAEAARGAIATALTGTLDEANITLLRLNETAKVVSRDLEPVLRDLLHAELVKFRMEHGAIVTAFTGTLEEANVTLARLNQTAKAISAELEPVLRESLRTELLALRTEIPRLVDLGTAKSGAATAELLHEQRQANQRAMQSLESSLDAHASTTVSALQTLNVSLVSSTDKAAKSVAALLATGEKQHRDMAETLRVTSNRTTGDLRVDLATLARQLSDTSDRLDTATTALNAERVRVRRVESKHFRTLVVLLLLSVATAFLLALPFLR